VSYARFAEWCEVHGCTGRGPSPVGPSCHYAALHMLTFGVDSLDERCRWTRVRIEPEPQFENFTFKVGG
jgi:hypothetical protein